jgi:glycine cleavage system H protein
MSEIPTDLRYTETHEWVSNEEDGTIKVGITDHAQSQLGDLVYVELPEVGDRVEAGDACAVVESVKAASDVYSPVTGEITAVNEDLEDSPELVNQDAFGDGWLFALNADDAGDADKLMDAEAYADSIED